MKKIFIPVLAILAVVVLGLIVWSPWKQKNAAPISTEKPSIVILPFEDISFQKDQEPFCLGLAATLINAFTQISELRIPAITSSSMIKEKNIQVIGETLNVSHVLKGQLQKAENRLRITAQLIKVDDGTIVWSDQRKRT